jgi:uncharacterized lipoprotein YddW (UPF0748 family)
MNTLAFALLAFSLTEAVLDDFRYADAAAAASVWSVTPPAPALQLTEADGRTAVQLAAPFRDQPELARVYVDRRVDLDLSAAGGFVLEAEGDPPESLARVSLYFHSRDGWYSAGGRATKPGWQQLGFAKSAFGTEDAPAGWDKVDGIRIAFWRGSESAPANAVIRLRRLTAVQQGLALVVPGAAGELDDAELRSARSISEDLEAMLTSLGLEADTIDETTVTATQGRALGKRPVAILAYNPRLGDETAAALAKYVEAGGKLLVCYQLHPSLAAALGFSRGEYVRPERTGQLAEIRFQADEVTGLPSRVRQASWNITTAKPVSHNARIIGWWYDDAGQPTNWPAMLLSDRGAFFSHVFLTDDYDRKTQWMASVLGHLAAPLWQQIADRSLQRAESVGHCGDLDELKEFLEASGNTESRRLAEAGLTARATAQQHLASNDFPAAVRLAGESRELLAQAYLRAHPSPEREGRAVWNHSGTGAYPGDWERSAKVLADNDFNIVLPNMLWGGLAHYASDILPRSATFAEHGDQIEQCVAAAHRHGLEVHVWKVNYNLSNAPREFVARLRQAGRTQVSARGEAHDWLCPSHPKNQRLEVDSMLEVARRYQVDGLHFDYIRYPDGEHCYCDGCRQRFESESSRKVENWPEDCYRGARRAEYRDWRCRQITRVVKALHDEAKQLSPKLKISAAVFGSYPSCRESVGQDWPEWIKAGLLDFVCPMDYTESDDAFCSLVENQMQLVAGRTPIYPGIGATASRSALSADRVVGQIYHARRLGAAGFTIFNFSPDVAEAILPGVGAGAGSARATPPH